MNSLNVANGFRRSFTYYLTLNVRYLSTQATNNARYVVCWCLMRVMSTRQQRKFINEMCTRLSCAFVVFRHCKVTRIHDTIQCYQHSNASIDDYIILQVNSLLKHKFGPSFFRLFEVGKLSIPIKSQEKYETGQFFLHRVFGYRGVILFPWRAKVYDRNSYVPKTDSTDQSAPSSTPAAVDASETAQTDAKDDGNSTQQTNEKADATPGNSVDDDTMRPRRVGSKEITVNVQTYYQVLIDSRDCPHVVQLHFQYYSELHEMIIFFCTVNSAPKPKRSHF